MIIFIASIVVAAGVAGVFTDSVGELSEAIGEQGVDVSSDVRTDVEIISDSGSAAVYNASQNRIRIHVKNTGSQRLPPEANQFDVFVNGRYEVDVTSTLIAGGDQWGPGDVVRLDITQSLDPGDHRVKLIVNGDEEVFEFRS
jgi:flagellar protein FlaG